MGLEGYYFTDSQDEKYDDIYCEISMNIIDTSFNPLFYNDPNFYINDTLNPLYVTEFYEGYSPYISILESNLIYKDAYYKIDKILTNENIIYSPDMSVNNVNVYVNIYDIRYKYFDRDFNISLPNATVGIYTFPIELETDLSFNNLLEYCYNKIKPLIKGDLDNKIKTHSILEFLDLSSTLLDV